MFDFSECPRCGSESMEVLLTHSYCIDCNYSPTFEFNDEETIPAWALQALGEDKSSTKKRVA